MLLTDTPVASPKKVSRTHKPEDMTLEEWQILLRRQYGLLQEFMVEPELEALGEYRVTNPASGRTYSVILRGGDPGDSSCTCPDHATNTLGTCKHIEYCVAILEGTEAGRAVLDAGWDPAENEIWLRYGESREVRLTLRSGASERFRTQAQRIFDEGGRLRSTRYRDLTNLLQQAMEMGEPLHCREDVMDYMVQRLDGQERAYRFQQYDVTGLLKTRLLPYQETGVLFAARAGRALLADDMGLGKTVQALAYAELMAREYGVEKVLIVCPSSLKFQWYREIQKFTERSATLIQGPAHVRALQYAEPGFFKIVNYDVLHRDLDAIAAMMPDVLILDEAQRIKNWKTRAAKAVKSIDSPYALVLTGTPLENRLEELHSIVSFVDRHRLGPIFRFLHEHQETDEAGKVVGYKNLSSISRTLEPVMLRRTKAAVLDQLPERIEKNFFVPLTPRQRVWHEEQRDIVARLVAKWRRYRFLTDTDQHRLMVALQRMRMVCDSTYLLDTETRFGVKVDEAMVLLQEILEDPCAKVVVFSQWHKMHELVIERLENAGVSHVYLHGGVPSSRRGHLVESFHDDPAVRIFLSTDAGGVGLNLQCASTVINLDLPWNPAVLEQRIARVHRLGQHRSVNVINFVAENSIEHGMLSLLRFKQGLFAGVLDGGDDAVHLEGSRLKQFIDTVESTTGEIPVEEIGSDWTGEAEADEEVLEVAPDPVVNPVAALSQVLTSAAQLVASLQSFATQAQGMHIERDARTGQASLRIPLGDSSQADGLEQVLPVLSSLAQAFASALSGTRP